MTIRHRSALLDSPMEETSKSTQSNSSCNEYGDKRRTRRKKTLNKTQSRLKKCKNPIAVKFHKFRRTY